MKIIKAGTRVQWMKSNGTFITGILTRTTGYHDIAHIRIGNEIVITYDWRVY